MVDDLTMLVGELFDLSEAKLKLVLSELLKALPTMTQQLRDALSDADLLLFDARKGAAEERVERFFASASWNGMPFIERRKDVVRQVLEPLKQRRMEADVGSLAADIWSGIELLSQPRYRWPQTIDESVRLNLPDYVEEAKHLLGRCSSTTLDYELRRRLLKLMEDGDEDVYDALLDAVLHKISPGATISLRAEVTEKLAGEMMEDQISRLFQIGHDLVAGPRGDPPVRR